MKILFLIAGLVTPLAAMSMSDAHENVLRQFKSSSEKQAKDALWTSASMFKVGVVDNGTPRDGYARYVCQTISDAGLGGKGITVQIIDIAKLVRTDKWIKLGEQRCS